MRLLFSCACTLLIVLSTHAYSKPSNYAKTRYPIVMVGGATAFDSFNIGFIKIDYWFGITDALRRSGAEVYVTNLSGFSSNENRADELYDDILAIKAMTGADKVNLFAHSQGALAARMATQMLRETGHEVVASVTTFAGMNRGTQISPWARQQLEKIGITHGSIGEQLLDAFVGIVGTFLWEGNIIAGTDGDYNSEQRGWQSLLALENATHPDKVAEINQRFPDALPAEDCMANGSNGDVSQSGNALANGVFYYSFGAHSNADLTSFSELFDPIYLGLAVPLQQLVVNRNSRDFSWDGLVPQCGHKLGKFIGSWKMNHFDAVGHFAGLRPSFVNDLYLTQANRLKQQGL
ncbi:Lactonizing lipase [Thalassocella blandensis]|nr:Lactonizing lipase [Thalassocella blandensis]